MRLEDLYLQIEEGERITKPIIPCDFPRIITLCGSTRFKKEYEEAQARLTNEGVIVLSVGRFGHKDGLDMAGPVKIMLDELHLRKIDLADGIFVIDVPCPRCGTCKKWWKTPPSFSYPFPDCGCSGAMEKEPYVGESTRREIDYALANGKEVRYLSEG